MPTENQGLGSLDGPWNPGVQSALPLRLMSLSTIFRPENTFTGLAQATELRDLTGLPLEDLAIFRPERLTVHELLVRVTADISVPDPDSARIDDLGINFREIVRIILTTHIAPHLPEIINLYASLRLSLQRAIEAEMATLLSSLPQHWAVQPPEKLSFLGLFRRPGQRDKATLSPEEPWQREERVIRTWNAEITASDDGVRRAACRALIKVVSAVRSRHGRWWGEQRLLGSLAVDLACNEYCSQAIGRYIEPIIKKACAREGYSLLAPQERPVVMNVKGASASGKSTMRPLQRKMAADLGVRWSDFALISPDIWRKYLLDYASLGDDYRYAGALTGRELEIVDRKLDRYTARKAAGGGISHLLIDRFRFDSFAPDSDEAGSNLLTRFGWSIHMFFMITPPHETVVRSWQRGLAVGRYKAVDDLLAHNIEAYSGMPALFFTWALRPGKSVYFEFLDNDVPHGERPRTVAFGHYGEMNILDVKGILDIDRYRKINVDATTPEQVYRDQGAVVPESNIEFLMQCIDKIPVVNFADRDTGRVYACFESGHLTWTDPPLLDRAFTDDETRAGLSAVAPDIRRGGSTDGFCRALPPDHVHTVGRWGKDIGQG